jgi:hypothetical protein
VDLAMKALGGGKRARAAEGAAGGLSELRNTFGRSMKMIDDNRVSDAANRTFDAMTRITMLLARNKTTPVHEVLNGLTMEQIKLLQTSIASTNIAARYKSVAKCLMGNISDAVEQATAQLKDCEKVIMDGTVLLLNSHYGVAGTMSWETFSADMTEAIATKAAQAGAIAGAAAAAAHHAGAGAGGIQFG